MNEPEIVLISDSRVSSLPIQGIEEPWVDLATDFPQLKCDANEPTVQKYSDNSFQVRREVARRLVQAQTTLPKGVFLEIKECYRPLWVQRKFWVSYSNFLKGKYPEMSLEQINDEAAKYIAPLHVAPHSTGGAVDLVLVDDQGQPLDMGTSFNASPAKTENRTFTNSKDISMKAQRNRQMLVQAMTEAGFVNYPTEWWHWSYGDQYWAYSFRKAEALYSRRRPGFQIRKSQSKDAEAAARVHTASWKTTYRGIVQQAFLDGLSVESRLASAQRRVSNPDGNCYVAIEEDSNQLMGFVEVGPCREKNVDADGEMYAIYLYEEFQGLGAGTLLFDAGVTALKEKGFSRMMVSVLESNETSRRFYEARGGNWIGADHVDIEGRRYPTSTYLWQLK
jgi:D-alanyl-D-alanine dipeptidase